MGAIEPDTVKRTPGMTGRTVVVGLDSSTEAADALEWAVLHTGKQDRIVVVRAWDVPLLAGPPGIVSVLPVDFAQFAKEALATSLESTDDARITAHVHRGRPGPTIVETGDESDADLVVVGHRGDTRASFVIGSTANHVLHHSTRPVVVVRGTWSDAPRRVVVGIDLHPSDDLRDTPSVRALRWACRLPGVEQIRVVHAWHIPPMEIEMYATIPIDPMEIDATARREIDRVIDAAGVRPDGVDIVAEVVRGAPAAALVDASKDADLVVVGSRGRGAFTRLLAGSTSAAVAAHSSAPVAVIP